METRADLPAVPYPLDNHHAAAGEHHTALSELLDPFTIERIRRLRPWTRATCLEVGAGAGSVALWLADQVGAEGRVLATDLKPGRIPHHPRLEVLAHDLTAPGDLLAPLAGQFDLVHARLVLSHLPPRHAILGRLASLLAPGGVLLIEDWVPRRRGMVVAAPSPEAADLYTAYQRAAGTIFDTAGTDPAWGKRVHTAMREEDLTDVQTVVHGEYWVGGGPGMRLVSALVLQLRPRLLAAGLTDQQLGHLLDLLNDPRLVVEGHRLYSTSGVARPHHRSNGSA